MANSISSFISTANSERKILSDEKPLQNDISDLGTKALNNSNEETYPRKKITTLLHRIPSTGAGKKGTEILQTTKPCSLDEKEKERIKLTLKSFFQFEYSLAILQISGWTIQVREDFAIDPYDQVVQISDLKNRFKTMNSEFISFLESKKLHYDENSGLIADEFEVLPVDQSSALLKEFTGVNEKEKTVPSTKPISDISVKTSSKKYRAQDNKKIGFEKQALVHQECIRLSNGKEGKIKLVLKALMQLEYFLGYLQVEGWSLEREGVIIAPTGEEYPLSSQKDIFDKDSKRFSLFLDKKKLHYDPSSGLLSSNSKRLTFEESYTVIKEFNESSKQNEGKKEPFFVKLSIGNEVLSDTRIAPLSQQFPDFEDVKSVFVTIMDYNNFLNALMDLEWTVNVDKGLLLNPEGKNYDLNDMTEKWKKNKTQVLSLVGHDSSKLDQFYDLMKDPVLAKLIKDADKLGMKYDKEMNLFINGDVALTLEQMIMRITLDDMGMF